jgi:hypothetical protein
MKTLIKNTFTTYNNTVNLITHIVERHFSILNKFKHLLVFGTLALSLNVTSGDVNQFNKQAYLDLNTEYDWNQPQSYYRKDNQATTLLKETVGIIHGAHLGFTLNFKFFLYYIARLLYKPNSLNN